MVNVLSGEEYTATDPLEVTGGTSKSEISALYDELTKAISDFDDVQTQIGSIGGDYLHGLESRITNITDLTPYQAAELGVDIEEGYKLRISPAADGNLALGLLTSDGWEIRSENEIISPEGKTYTKAEFYDYLASELGQDITEGSETGTTEGQPGETTGQGGILPAPTLENIAPSPAATTGVSTGETAAAIDTDTLIQTLTSLFPGQDLDQIYDYMEQNPEGFLNDILEIGKTTETVNLLKALLPEITDEQIDEIFSPADITSSLEDEIKNDPILSQLFPETAEMGSWERSLAAVGWTWKDFTDWIQNPETEEVGFWDKVGGFTSRLLKTGMSAVGVPFWPLIKAGSALNAGTLYFTALIKQRIGQDTEYDRNYINKWKTVEDRFGPFGLFSDELMEAVNYYGREGFGHEEWTIGSVHISKNPASLAWSFVSDIVNPVYLIPIGGTFSFAASVTSKLPIIGRGMKILSAAVNGAEKVMSFPIEATLKTVGATGKGLETVLRKVGSEIDDDMADSILKSTKNVLVELPTYEQVGKEALGDNWMKSVLRTVGNIGTKKTKPFKWLVRAIDPRILVKEGALELEGIVGEAAVHRNYFIAAGQQLRSATRLYLRGIAKDAIDLFGFNESGVATKVRGLSSKATNTLEDIFTHPELYDLNVTQREYVTRTHELFDGMLGLLKKEGLADPKATVEDWVHRVVIGKRTETGEVIAVKGKPGVGSKALGAKRSYEKARKFTTQAEGIAKGIIYENNPEEWIGSFIEDAFVKIADGRFNNVIERGEARLGIKFGNTPTELLVKEHPELFVVKDGQVVMKRGKNGKPVPLSKVMLKGEQVKAADDFSKLISSVIRGEKPSEATLAKIERLFPEYGKKFRQLATVTEADIKIDQLIRTTTSNLDEISKVLSRTTKELEELKMQRPGIIEKARAEGFEAGRAAAVATSPAEVIPEIKPETKPKIKLEEAKSLAWMKEDELHAAFKGMSQEDLHTWHDKLNAVREEYGRITEEAKANIDVINAMLAEDPVYNYRVPMGVKYVHGKPQTYYWKFSDLFFGSKEGGLREYLSPKEVKALQDAGAIPVSFDPYHPRNKSQLRIDNVLDSMFSELGFEGKGRLNPADEFREKMSSLRSMVQKRKEMERVLASSDIDTGIMKALKIVDDLTTTPEVPEIMPSVARTYSQGDMWEGVVSIMETGMESPAGKRMTDIFQKLDDIIRGLDAGDTKAVLSEIDNLRTYLKTGLAGDLTQRDAQTIEAIYTILVDFPVDDPVSELIMEIYDNVLNQNPKAARNALNNLEQHLSKPKITQVIEGMTPEDAATLAAMQQTGAPEAGLQAGFGGEEVLTFDTLKPHVPKSKGKTTQINMDDFMKLQEVYNKQGKQPGMAGYAVKPEIEGIRGMEDPKAPVLKLELQTPGLKTKSQRIIELNNMKKEIKLLMEGRKTEYWEARAKHASEMAKIREPAIGEGYLFEPMFAGKIYTQEFKDAVNVWFGRNPGSKVLSFVSDTAGILRLKAGMDFSYMMLQGLPSFGLAHAYLLCNPRIGVQMIGRWYKALGYSVLSAISPDNFYKYINKNIDGVYQRIAMGGSSATLDYFDILHSSGSLSGMVNKLLDNIPLKPMERADLAWLSGGEYVRNTFWDLLKDDAIKSGNERQLAVFLDRMTGIIDTTSMGVPRTVQQLESSFIWFAPRYTRACLSLLSGIFRGGYTGTMARKAIGGMLGAGVMYYVGTQYAIASLNGLSAEDAWKSIEEGFGITEDPITGEISWKPSSRMMTIKVGNYYFGIGSFWYGLVRLAGNINDAIGMQISNKGITFDPDTDRIDMVRILKGGTINRDNPFVQWWYSRSSPLVGSVMDLLQHTDYMGNPIETEEQYAHYILSMFEPIWMEQGLNPMLFPQFVQDYEIPEGAARKLIIPGELFGLRTFPESRWIKFYDKVNELVSHLPIDMIDEKQAKAWREGKLGWKNLTAQQQQYLLQNYPELSELYQQAIADSALKDSKVWKNWNTRMEAEKATYYEQLAKLDQQLKDGTITTAQYREAASLAGQNYGYAIQSIENDPNYAEIYEYISNAEDPGVNYGFTDSLALAEYESTILYAGDLELSNGDYDWAERDRRTDAFIEKWGQKTYDDIQTYLLNKKSSKGMSQIAIKKAEDTQKLGREYWRLPWKEIASMNAAEAAELGPVYKTMWDNLQAITDPDERTAYLKSHPELTKDWRAEYRKANPEIDAMLALWGYSGKIQSVEAYNLVMQWVKELGISTQSLGLEFPTAKILQNYLEYNDMVGQYGANSYEAKLYRIEHPEWDKYGQDTYGWKAIDTTVNPELLKLNIQWRDSDSEYDSITDSAARAAYLETHPEYHDARLIRNAIEAGFDSQFIPAYKTYYKLPATGYEQEWFLIENQQFYQKAKELLGWKDKDFSKVPTRKVSGLLDEYNKLPEGTARKKFRLEHPELDAYFVLAKGYKPASDAYLNIPRSQVFAWDEFNQ